MRQDQAAYRPGWWQRTKWPRYTFITGIVFGIILGWLLHGIITFILKFSLVVLLLAILVGLFFAWRAFSGRGKRNVTVVTWQGVNGHGRRDDDV